MFSVAPMINETMHWQKDLLHWMETHWYMEMQRFLERRKRPYVEPRKVMNGEEGVEARTTQRAPKP